jgi:hypothetical protein
MHITPRFSESGTGKDLGVRRALVLEYNQGQSAMPRVTGRGALERSAIADLFKHTLSQIPTVFGQIMYLASLRDPNSGVYRHHGLSVTFGRQDSVQALSESHTRVFLEWLEMPLAEKHPDLIAYLESLEDGRDAAIRHWRRTKSYLVNVPSSATSAEKELFSKDLDLLLEVL